MCLLPNVRVQGDSAGLAPLKWVDASVVPLLCKSRGDLGAGGEKLHLLGHRSVQVWV